MSHDEACGYFDTYKASYAAAFQQARMNARNAALFSPSSNFEGELDEDTRIREMVRKAPAYLNESIVWTLLSDEVPPCKYAAHCNSRVEVIMLERDSLKAMLVEFPYLRRKYMMFREVFFDHFFPDTSLAEDPSEEIEAETAGMTAPDLEAPPHAAGKLESHAALRSVEPLVNHSPISI
jgi:hypothetical protein